jgi:hypothetical protein
MHKHSFGNARHAVTINSGALGVNMMFDQLSSNLGNALQRLAGKVCGVNITYVRSKSKFACSCD